MNSPSDSSESRSTRPLRSSARPQLPSWLLVAWRGRRGPWSFWRTLLTVLLAPPLVATLFTYGLTALAWPMPLKLVGMLTLLIAAGALFLFFRAIVRTFVRFGVGRLLIVAVLGSIVAVVFVGLTVPSGERGVMHWIVTTGDVFGDAWRSMQRSTRALWRVPDALIFTAKGQRSPAQVPGVSWPGGVPPTPIIIRAGDSITATNPSTPDVPTPTSVVPSAAPSQLKIGDRVQVVGTEGAPLRAREAPSANAKVVARFAPGAVLEIVAGPERSDGREWWRVRGTSGEGWCASEFLAAQ